MAVVGYYAIDRGQWEDYQRDELTDGGHDAREIADLTAAELAAIDVLYATNSDNSAYGSEFLASLQTIWTAVENGMSLMVFDRYVDNAEMILPNGNVLTIVRDFSDQARIELALEAPDGFVNGPGGTITNDTFDDGSASSHGYVERSSLPDGAIALLTTTDPDHIVAFSYPHGDGTVFYSTIPLDFYSVTSRSSITPADVSLLVNNTIAHIQGDHEPAPLVETSTIFAEEGKLSFLSQLALAAYRLADDERVHTLKNDFKANSEIAFHGQTLIDTNPDLAHLDAHRAHLDFTGLDQYLRLLDYDDIGLDVPAYSGDIYFVNDGLRDGIFTNSNAAALVARSSDALFLSFRGTNDARDAEGGFFNTVLGNTPDKEHWNGKNDHFDLLKGLVDKLREYASNADNGIQKIYVTGHSLGAAMIEKLMRYWDDWDFDVEAVAFASPGYGGPVLGTEERLTNFWVDGDPILGAAFLANNEGDRNTIYHNLNEGDEIADDTTLHSMSLYQKYMAFIESEGFDLSDVISLNGLNYARIYAFAEVISEADQIFRIATGDDYIVGSGVKDIILGGAGEDTVYGHAGKDYIDGGKGNDLLVGTLKDNWIYGRGGHDEIIGDRYLETDPQYGLVIYRDGKVIAKEANFGGKDTLDGGAGQDTIYGGHDADSILGGTGNDSLFGNNDDDTLKGDSGFDTLKGGSGDDWLYGGVNADSLEGGSGEDTLLGEAGNDTLIGGTYGDVLRGGTQDDVLYGYTGADKLFGGADNDQLFGNAGQDTLEGGSGDDIFVFWDEVDTGQTRLGADLITDFDNTGENDRIDFTYYDANQALAGLQDFIFIGAASFSGTLGELKYHYKNGNTILKANTEGFKAADMTIELQGIHVLTESDFIF